MKETIARLTDLIADLNGIVNTVSDNDEVEFDVGDRLASIETHVETLSNEVEETVSFAAETSS